VLVKWLNLVLTWFFGLLLRFRPSKIFGDRKEHSWLKSLSLIYGFLLLLILHFYEELRSAIHRAWSVFSFFKFLSGSGLHTFVMYLGPHIALFTIKAMQCGRVDLKSAPYDTIQLKRGPSWLDRDCHEYGDPVFPLSHGLRVPLSSILPQVQVEAILWGVGTALGELPPYFISRAGMCQVSAAVIWISGWKFASNEMFV
jgi:hypothetical protein